VQDERPDRDSLLDETKRDPEGVVDVLLSLWDRSVELEKLYSEQEQRLRDLERNSRNSSKPPSSDQSNLVKPPKPKSQRKPSGKKPGGQPGHKGSTLEMVDNPDHIIESKIESGSKCEICGEILPVNGCCGSNHEPEVRQVVELPAIRVEVTEFRNERIICPNCDHLNVAPFPDEVKARAQYGPNLKATAIYLGNYQLVPYERLAELFNDIFQCPISQGTLANFVKAGGRQAGIVVEHIKGIISESDTVYADETGCRVHGARQWLHVASTNDFTSYMIHPKRGFEALQDFGILEGFTGNLIHDYYSSYYKLLLCMHFQCVAHILRELTYLHEEMDQDWAKDMKDLLLEAKDLRDRENQRLPDQRKVIGEKTRDRIQERYADIVLAGYSKNPEPEPIPGKRGKPKRGKALNLLIRFENQYEEIMGFFEYDDIPFDNNQAERDLRMMKIREKISGTFRSDAHSQAFCDIRSVISTLKKQGRSVMGGIAEMLRIPGEMFRSA
jgi:transposase